MKFSLTANANAQHVLQLSISNSTPIYLTKWQTNSVDSQNSFSGLTSMIIFVDFSLKSDQYFPPWLEEVLKLTVFGLLAYAYVTQKIDYKLKVKLN